MFSNVIDDKWGFKRLSGLYAALKIHELVNWRIRGFVFFDVTNRLLSSSQEGSQKLEGLTVSSS